MRRITEVLLLLYDHAYLPLALLPTPSHLLPWTLCETTAAQRLTCTAHPSHWSPSWQTRTASRPGICFLSTLRQPLEPNVPRTQTCTCPWPCRTTNTGRWGCQGWWKPCREPAGEEAEALWLHIHICICLLCPSVHLLTRNVSVFDPYARLLASCAQYVLCAPIPSLYTQINPFVYA